MKTLTKVTSFIEAHVDLERFRSNKLEYIARLELMSRNADKVSLHIYLPADLEPDLLWKIVYTEGLGTMERTAIPDGDNGLEMFRNAFPSDFTNQELAECLSLWIDNCINDYKNLLHSNDAEDADNYDYQDWGYM